MKDAESLAELVASLAQPTALVGLAVLVACLGLAALLTTRWRPRGGAPGIWFGARGFDGVLFPLLALALALLARQMMRGHLPLAVFRLALPMLARIRGQVAAKLELLTG